MTDLKVVSKKYNDADVLEVSNFEEESTKEVNKVIEGAQTGTINKVLGLNSSGKLVKGTISGGTKLYTHLINIGSEGNFDYTLTVINSANTAYSSIYEIEEYQALHALVMYVSNSMEEGPNLLISSYFISSDEGLSLSFYLNDSRVLRYYSEDMSMSDIDIFEDNVQPY